MPPPPPFLPLNPFLSAFLQSNLPAHCIPAHDHILLVPITETLIGTQDRESGTPYEDLVVLDEFLSSHILRIPVAAGAGDGIAVGSRDARGKARQFSTVNGRTVIVKDSWVYSKAGEYFPSPPLYPRIGIESVLTRNAGFRNPTQAQLLYDHLYYPDVPAATPWLIYYISKPLIGYVEPIPLAPPPRTDTKPKATPSKSATLSAKYKDVQSFQELLLLFPMISRKLQHGMQQILLELEESLIRTPTSWKPREEEEETVRSSASSVAASDSSASYAGSSSSQTNLLGITNGHATAKGISEEFQLRKAFESALSQATDLFQRVDQPQMDLLAQQTNLTDGDIDRLIERYIAEQVHEHILMPRMKATKEGDDTTLGQKIAKMRNIDMIQVGIPCVDKKSRASMSARLRRGVTELEKLPAARSPQAAVDIILKTAQALTQSEKVLVPDTPQDEKASAMTINADMLVSMLLLVVIRAKVGLLNARLAYMRTFLVFDDVDQGETGYILSTLEAVMFHIMHDNDNLIAASKANGDLWKAVRQGDLTNVRRILHIPETAAPSVASEEELGTGLDGIMESPEKETDMGSQESEGTPPDAEELRGRLTRAVDSKVQTRSRSNTSIASSIRSFAPLSRTLSARSMGSIGIDITSAEILCKCRNPAGESLLMIAVQSGQAQILKFLLDTEQFPPDFLLDDENDEGTTLLSAAIQAGQTQVADVLLSRLLRLEDEAIYRYFQKTDKSGRTVAHYLFNTPDFITKLAGWLPWTKKDKNGQTPLFALCRSYDHSQYKIMVEHALSAARDSQRDNAPLHLDQHVDAKGNTLLHIAGDPELLRNLMDSDAEINAVNERGFTPLMLASKYGRIEAVKVLYEDPRVDLQIREARGLTAVELAKDDEVRNAIDDIVLFENPISPSGHIVGVVRAFFVEDGTTRFIVKTGTPRQDQPTITVRTTRRSLSDFQFLAKQLMAEHPGTWVPPIPNSNSQSPYQLPSKPSRTILREIQLHLDFFLRALLSNPTFSTHELVWEFFILPEIQTQATEMRSKAKLHARSESLDELVMNVVPQGVGVHAPFLEHAREVLLPICRAYEDMARAGQRAVYAGEDMASSMSLLHTSMASIPKSLLPLPETHLNAVSLAAKALAINPSHPYTITAQQTRLFSSSIGSLLSTLALPAHLLPPKHANLKSPNPFSSKPKTPIESPVDKARRELEAMKYVEAAADEVAGGEAWRVRWGRDRVRMLARGMLVRERMVLEGLRRAGREIGVGKK